MGRLLSGVGIASGSLPQADGVDRAYGGLTQRARWCGVGGVGAVIMGGPAVLTFKPHHHAGGLACCMVSLPKR